MRKYGFGTAVLLAVCLTTVVLSANDRDEKRKEAQAAVEKALPGYDQFLEKATADLRPFLDSKDAHVQEAVACAQLQMESLRSIRSLLAFDRANSWAYLFPTHVRRESAERWQEGFRYFLGCAQDNKDPFKGMFSGERACRSPIDGHIVFYKFKLPKDYDSKKKYPLHVDLHYGGALTWRALWVRGKPSSDPRTEPNPEQEIWISPDGRGNNHYTGMGETAVLEAMDHALTHFAVDEDRVRIGGGSMGGTGAHRLATFYPDRFAAFSALSGAAEYLPEVPLMHSTSVLDNLCNVGSVIWTNPPEIKRYGNQRWADGMDALAKAYPGHFPHQVYIDPKGGHGICDRKMLAQGEEFLKRQKRNRYRKLVMYKTWNLRHDGAYWATIDTMAKVDKPARIEAEMQDGGKLRVEVENVDRFHLRLVEELVGDAKDLTVRVNGGKPFSATVSGTIYFAKKANRWGISEARYPKGLVKKHGVSGPVWDVFMGEPVLMVYGTLDGKDAKKGEALTDAIVARLFGAADGGSVLHTGFERRADKEIGARDLADKNLVLIGTPKENAFLKQVADKLPVKFLDDGIEVGGRAYRGAGVGLLMVYPNPINPDRCILILPENYALLTAHTYASQFQYPDYVVGRPGPGYQGQTLKILAQGTFDGHWQLPQK